MTKPGKADRNVSQICGFNFFYNPLKETVFPRGPIGRTTCHIRSRLIRFLHCRSAKSVAAGVVLGWGGGERGWHSLATVCCLIQPQVVWSRGETRRTRSATENPHFHPFVPRRPPRWLLFKSVFSTVWVLAGSTTNQTHTHSRQKHQIYCLPFRYSHEKGDSLLPFLPVILELPVLCVVSTVLVVPGLTQRHPHVCLMVSSNCDATGTRDFQNFSPAHWGKVGRGASRLSPVFVEGTFRSVFSLSDGPSACVALLFDCKAPAAGPNLSSRGFVAFACNAIE